VRVGQEGALERPTEVLVARAALMAAGGVAGVAGISRGRYAVARTFGLGGTVVEGVQLSQTAAGLHVELHVTVQLVPIPPLAAAVRAAVAAVLDGLGVPAASVDIWVDALHSAEAKENEACRS
jgi:hypothetical protein